MFSPSCLFKSFNISNPFLLEIVYYSKEKEYGKRCIQLTFNNVEYEWLGRMISLIAP